MSKPFKPMLSIMWERDKCTFPKQMSRKLDGVRCEVTRDGLQARSLKPIANKNLTAYFSEMIDYVTDCPDGFVIVEGEFHCKGMKRNEITAIVNSHDAEIPEGFYLGVFDIYMDSWRIEASLRNVFVVALCTDLDSPKYVAIPQTIVNSVEEVESEFEKAIAEGDEGLILKDPVGLYKFGKSTVNQGLSLKVKPFETFDTECLGITQRFKNLNESKVNELGQLKKSNTKDAKEPTGIAATLLTKLNGKEVSITLTGTEAERRKVWENQDTYIGKVFEWKGMSHGMKDVPTHSTFIGWREDKS